MKPTDVSDSPGDLQSHEEFYYSIDWPTRSVYPGAHLSGQQGSGQRFKRHAPLLNHPDPRRIDLRASAFDPFQGYWVRVFNQRSNIPVYVIADLSASMGYLGKSFKLDIVTDFVFALSASSGRLGDRFGFIGCDNRVREDLMLPASSQVGAARHIVHLLSEFTPTATSAQGLAECYPYLRGERALVFLVSDFHLPLADIETIVLSLSRHDVVPIVVWDSKEYSELPDYGLIRLRDPESGQYRTLLLRPDLKARISDGYAERKRRLTQLFLTHGREPFFIIDRLVADRLNEYFFYSR